MRRLEKEDAVPCPRCGNRELDIFANVVECIACDYEGPRQSGPELICDWRVAIEDWNEAAKQ